MPDVETPTRRAVVRGGKPETIERYMPGNYSVVGVTDDGDVLIEGRDSCGWTLDDYVIPRLASGLYFCEEIHR